MKHEIMRLARESEEALLDVEFGSLEEYVDHLKIPILYEYFDVLLKWIRIIDALQSLFHTYHDIEREIAEHGSYNLITKIENCEFIYLNNILGHVITLNNLKLVKELYAAGVSLSGVSLYEDILMDEEMHEMLEFLFSTDYEFENLDDLLFIAIQDNVSDEIIQLLINNGADIYFENEYGNTLLQLFENEPERRDRLIRFGAKQKLESYSGCVLL